VGLTDVFQRQHLCDERSYEAALEEPVQLLQPRPLTREEHAIERLVLLVERRERTVSVSQILKPSSNAPLTSKSPSGLVRTLSLSILYTWWRSAALRLSNSSGTIRA
jgi:hypothetical protein